MPDYWERKLRLLKRADQQHVADSEAPGEQVQLASIVAESIVDGPGLRFVLFTQGCPHRCLGCHNPQTHLSIGGTFYSPSSILALYEKAAVCRGITFSGGEPFLQAGALATVATAIHQQSAGDIIVYTGYRLEQLQRLAQTDAGVLALLNATDLLIDGPYIQEKRCLDAPLVGSLNQRLISLSPLGNRLLEDIPLTAQGQKVQRVYWA